MASIRRRSRKDGSESFAVLYRLDGQQSSTSFDDAASAQRFCDQANKFGVANALEMLGATISRDTTDRLRRMAAMAGQSDPWPFALGRAGERIDLRRIGPSLQGQLDEQWQALQERAASFAHDLEQAQTEAGLKRWLNQQIHLEREDRRNSMPW